jgi:hypothetical protein
MIIGNDDATTHSFTPAFPQKFSGYFFKLHWNRELPQV